MVEIIFIDLFLTIEIILARKDNVSGTASNRMTTQNSTDDDEFCRITIDSLTNSYKIGPLVKPRLSIGRQTRSASHSLLTTAYVEGKSIGDSGETNHLNCLDESSPGNAHTRESIQQEIDGAFTVELACTAFVQFCRLCGE